MAAFRDEAPPRTCASNRLAGVVGRALAVITRGAPNWPVWHVKISLEASPSRPHMADVSDVVAVIGSPMEGADSFSHPWPQMPVAALRGSVYSACRFCASMEYGLPPRQSSAFLRHAIDAKEG
jgi:hypothetical protein